jgi:phage gp37-like protein
MIALVGAGCGDEGNDEPAPAPRPPETADRVPDLPARWKVHVNSAGGFAFGLPPGWKAHDRDASTLVRSYDRLVAVSITPDRTNEALDTPLEQFATRALVALPSFEGQLEPGETRRFNHRYEAIAVAASGTDAESGVRQRLRLIVLRRDRLVTFTVLVAANRSGAAVASEAIAEQLVGTLRSRPIGAPAAPRGG